jgi:dTDP-4-amino-4,6-dideoxygalactose transaminase
MGTFSFQMSKNITAGEGGIVITNSKDYADLVRSYSNCGRTVDGKWYEHVYVGGNYRITEFQAAILLCQLARLEEQVLRRERNASYLNERLSKIPGIRLSRQDPRVTRRSHHLYMFRFLQEEFENVNRNQFVEALNAEGIPASAGYLTPVYRNRCFHELSRVPGLEHCPKECPCNGAFVDYRTVYCPVAERLCGEEAVWLPHSVLLGSPSDMDSIVQAVEKIYTHRKEIF